MIEFVPVEDWHVSWVGNFLRPHDYDEVIAAGSPNGVHSVREAVKVSHMSSTALVDGVPAAIFGLRKVSLIGNKAIPWMLGTRLATKDRRRFLEESKHVVAEMADASAILFNYVYSKNFPSIAYLTKLGFTVDTSTPVKFPGGTFYKFTMERPDV